MTTLPLGIGAYKRTQAASPEVKCVNRFLEIMPTNLKEHIALLSRPPTKLLAYFPADTTTGKLRRFATSLGMFNDDLFVVSGKNLWRYDGTDQVQISGEVAGTGVPSVAFVKGIGYERLFISDGVTLQYYDDGTQASGTLTDDGAADFTEVLNIGGTYYGWNAAVDTDVPNGTVSRPFLCDPGADPMAAMADMLNFDGTPGANFSTSLTGPSLLVTAASTALTLTLTAISHGADGNAIVTTVSDETHLTWGAATLAGGGVQALHGTPMPGGQIPGALTELNSYVFVAVAGTRKFYYIRPGEITIDPLLFAEKESRPDPIVDMKTVGDVAVIMGSGSTEFWAASGDGDNPFAPVEGRTLSRGIVPGTAVAVDESTIVVVGNDFRVYAIAGGPQRISDHGIEERIRRQIQREAGLVS